MEKLNAASHKLAEVMYKSAEAGAAGQANDAAAAGAEPSSSGAAGPQAEAEKNGKPDGEVIDAEYVDVDDKKKSG